MDYFKQFINKEVEVVCRLSSRYVDKSDVNRIVLNDVYVDKRFFRDHVWVKAERRLKGLADGSRFTATATLINYTSSEGKKFGLYRFRNIKEI